MSAPYRLYGAELSPYSQKVRSYLLYKGVSFQWLNRSRARQEEFQRYAKLPLIPILVDADEAVLQDSTPTIEALETESASLALEDPALAFLSALLEDYADEWVNKAMFHYRWSAEADCQSAAQRLVDGMFEGEDAPNRETIEAAVRERMVGRLKHVGSNPDTAPIIEASFVRLIQLLDVMLETRPYLFGGKPTLADFGLAAQLQQLLSDPTPGASIRAQAPRVASWCERMKAPKEEGPIEPFGALVAQLSPLLRTEVAGLYLTWMQANAEAVANDASFVEVELEGKRFSQAPQRYAAKAYGEIKRKYALTESEALAALMEESGCAPFLSGGGDDEGDEGEGEED